MAAVHLYGLAILTYTSLVIYSQIEATDIKVAGHIESISAATYSMAVVGALGTYTEDN
jgi:hypothetical protein